MPIDQPKRPSDESQDPKRDTFDIRELETMPDDDAEAEWLRHPEAWHMH